MKTEKSREPKRTRWIFDLPKQYLDRVRADDSTIHEATVDDVASFVETNATTTVPDTPVSEVTPEISEEGTFTCHTCGTQFDGSDEQRVHFKSDWHRLNVRRKLSRRPPISESAFEASLEEGDEVSSISGSDEDDDVEQPTGSGKQSVRGNEQLKGPRVGFSDADGVHFSLWKCVSGPDPSSGLQSLTQAKGIWVILLANGGHFAGAVFDWKASQRKAGMPPIVLAHRTFHRYVIRAKAGGRQSTKDGTGKTIKSAGSMLRRHNEAALEREIRELLENWREHLAKADLLFIHAKGVNGVPIFTGDKAAVRKEDPRVQGIPFATRRPTHSETQRVAQTLATVFYSQPSAEEAVEGKAAEPEAAATAASAVRVAASAEAVKTESAPETQTSAPQVDEFRSDLHVASTKGDLEAVTRLLNDGADPCEKDSRLRTPYTVAGNKAVRDIFRRYMASNPDQWDYSAAQIPSALTEDMEQEQALKKAEKDAIKKAKEKERKKAKKQREKEEKAAESAEVEKDAQEPTSAANASVAAACTTKGGAGAQLARLRSAKKEREAKSNRAVDRERELRAAAAERRMAGMSNGAPRKSRSSRQNVISKGGSSGEDGAYGGERCDACGLSLAGRTAFHRLNFAYCTTVCVREHKQVLES
ncbi:hypothetical protein CYMTET_14762 [Cymbomonas tetramitiformis]|uniref:VLRF1 domain-containing protein n=1 Tax=Cymbomonas tetramitiformis TaxID=36881 RepID=A0AAE0L9V1_9CHLO|nr:hypothetical protein CYMTET_14762 [Cymbomonas tetramitiformis]